MSDALGELATSLHGQGEELDALGRRALGLAAQVEACLEPGDGERVVWSEPDALAWAPVSVAQELRERLWEDGPTAVLVSATLTTGEDAGFVRRRLGLARCERGRRRLAVRLRRPGAALPAALDAGSP